MPVVQPETSKLKWSTAPENSIFRGHFRCAPKKSDRSGERGWSTDDHAADLGPHPSLQKTGGNQRARAGLVEAKKLGEGNLRFARVSKADVRPAKTQTPKSPARGTFVWRDLEKSSNWEVNSTSDRGPPERCRGIQSYRAKGCDVQLEIFERWS